MVLPVPAARSAVCLAVGLAVRIAARTRLIKSGMTELIIQLLLLRIAQHIICLSDLLELSLCFRIIRIHIRVVFLRKLPVCFFDRRRVCPLRQTEHFVIISFHCHIYHPLILAAKLLHPQEQRLFLRL